MGIFIGILVFFSSYALADRQGNGGDAIVCYNDEAIESAELFDLFEGRVLRGLVPSLGDLDISVEDKVYLALDRLDRLDSERAKDYRKRFRNFWNEVRLIDEKLKDVPDQGNISIDPSCAIEQVAIQKDPLFPEDRKFIIDKRIWDAFDNDSKASLILHEIIFEANLIVGHRNSLRTRYYNSLLVADSFSSMDQMEYQERIGKLVMSDNQIIKGRFSSYNNSFYQTLTQSFDILATFDEAEAFCEAKEMRLASALGLFSGTKEEKARLLKSKFYEQLADDMYWAGDGGPFNDYDFVTNPKKMKHGTVAKKEKYLFVCSKNLEDF